MEKIYFSACNADPYLCDIWAGVMSETPQEAANAFINSLKKGNIDSRLRAKQLTAVNKGCLRGVIEITAWFKKKDGTGYTMSNFGPTYRIAISIAEQGNCLPGPGTTHEMVNYAKIVGY